jgi:hypothetical protein
VLTAYEKECMAIRKMPDEAEKSSAAYVEWQKEVFNRASSSSISYTQCSRWPGNVDVSYATELLPLNWAINEFTKFCQSLQHFWFSDSQPDDGSGAQSSGEGRGGGQQRAWFDSSA